MTNAIRRFMDSRPPTWRNLMMYVSRREYSEANSQTVWRET